MRSKMVKIASYCKKLRKENRPKEVIDITQKYVDNYLFFQNETTFSNILCTRGGAFRDLNNPEAGLNLAKKAISINPEYCYPYNLAGACCYEMKKYKLGDKYFKTAESKGTCPDSIKNYKGYLRSQKQLDSEKWEEYKLLCYLPEYDDEDTDLDPDSFEQADLFFSDMLSNLLDDADCYAKSDDDGWFYEDGGIE